MNERMQEAELKWNCSGHLHDYYVRRARLIAARNRGPRDAEDWEAARPVLRSRFLKSLGLEPIPDLRNLRHFETGNFEGPGYTGKKIAYELLPDCWGSALFYRPGGLQAGSLTPAVLYACGHPNPGVVAYQEHAIAWARRGYSCLIFDTIQQHGNGGEHHGLNMGRTPDWIALGYTPAGGELLNGLRALEVLLCQPGVDKDRVGATGISGGGAQSLFLGIADLRIKAVATVAGVSDPVHALCDRHVAQHCDCMYLRNIFAQDLAAYAALIAPRAVMYCFARQDEFSSPAEFRDFYSRTRRHFEILGYEDRCVLHEYDGPHGYNTFETTDAIHCWFDQHVAGEIHPKVNTLTIREQGEVLDECVLSIYHGRTPEPNRLYLLPELLFARGQVDLPRRPEEWEAIKKKTLSQLKQETFHLLDDVEAAQQATLYGDCQKDEGKNGKERHQRWRGTLDGMAQEIGSIAPADNGHDRIIIGVGGRDSEAMALAEQIQISSGVDAVIGIQPRACGVYSFSRSHHNHLNREGCLIGLTPTMVMIQDLHHLWPLICGMDSIQGREMILYGRGEGAIAMLYHALLHPSPNIKAVILEDLPSSHSDTHFQIMGILRVMNIPHAVGLLAPVRVALIHAGGVPFHWYFAAQAHARTGEGGLLTASGLNDALRKVSK